VLVEAYRDISHIAIIAVNTGTNSVTQKFVLDGADVSSLQGESDFTVATAAG
jgi:hypothetical protein